MKILIDTNVILDMLGKREPFFEAAAAVIFLAAEEKLEAYITSNLVTDIYYIARPPLYAGKRSKRHALQTAQDHQRA